MPRLKPRTKPRPRAPAHQSKTSPARLEVMEKQRKAAEMRAQGYTLQEIADALGYKYPASAEKAIWAAIDRAEIPTVEAVRKSELARLAVLEAAIIKRATGVTPAQTLATDDGKVHVTGTQESALDRIVKLHERRARLLGLDAPTKVDTRNTFTTADVDELVATVRAIVRDVVLTRCGADVADAVDAEVAARVAGGASVAVVVAPAALVATSTEVGQ